MNTTTEKPDHEIAAEELDKFYATLNLKSQIRGGHIDYKDGWEHYAWNILFAGKGQASINYSMGTGHVIKAAGRDIPKNPSPSQALANSCLDFWESRAAFAGWCSNFGYDPDSIKALRMYDSCRQKGVTLYKIGLSANEIQTLAELSVRL